MESSNKDKNNYIKEIDKLLEMGFDKEKSIEVITLTKGNIELAIEYLYNGIPNNNIIDNDYQDGNNSLDANIGSADGDDEDEHGEDYEDTIYLLQKITAIFKIISNEKKKSMDEILKIIQKYNYKLHKFIKENEDEFKKCLSNPLEKSDYEIYDKFIKGKDNLGHYNLDYQIFDDDYEKKNIINDNNKKKNKNESIGNDVDILDFENDSFNNLYNANNKNNNINNFTDEENEIINKLKKLGNFTDEEVKQAYLICDKNEELTANYIFEHMNNKNNINRINIIDNDD